MNQVEEYRKGLSPSLRVVGLTYNHIGEKRQIILDNFGSGKIIMMDDNLTFYIRSKDGSKFMTMASQSESTIDMVTTIYSLLDRYASVGLVDKFMSQTKPRDYQTNQRFIHMLSYNRTMLPKGFPKFEVCHYEDHHAHLQLLTQGYKTAVLTEWSKTKSRAKGGCSDWRTTELMDEASNFMRRTWPDICIFNPERGADGAHRLIFRWKLARQKGALLRT
jgi:hypothetical protein